MNNRALDAYVASVLAAAPAHLPAAKREELTRTLRPGARKGRR